MSIDQRCLELFQCVGYLQVASKHLRRIAEQPDERDDERLSSILGSVRLQIVKTGAGSKELSHSLKVNLNDALHGAERLADISRVAATLASRIDEAVPEVEEQAFAVHPCDGVVSLTAGIAELDRGTREGGLDADEERFIEKTVAYAVKFLPPGSPRREVYEEVPLRVLPSDVIDAIALAPDWRKATFDRYSIVREKLVKLRKAIQEHGSTDPYEPISKPVAPSPKAAESERAPQVVVNIDNKPHFEQHAAPVTQTVMQQAAPIAVASNSTAPGSSVPDKEPRYRWWIAAVAVPLLVAGIAAWAQFTSKDPEIADRVATPTEPPTLPAEPSEEPAEPHTYEPAEANGEGRGGSTAPVPAPEPSRSETSRMQRGTKKAAPSATPEEPAPQADVAPEATPTPEPTTGTAPRTVINVGKNSGQVCADEASCVQSR